MATIFPGSASVGQAFNGYTFDGTVWNINGIDLTENYLEESSASAIYLNKVSASSTYLTQVNASTTYATKAYADNSSSAAVAALIDSAPSTLNTLNELAAALGDDANFATTITNALSPIGSVTAYALATPPAGWLLCDGSIYSASAYPTLSVGLGSTYGGNGTTTFAVPNLKGRMPVGLDSTQTEFDTRGETGGAKTHTLTSAEMPVHTHAQDSHNHTQNAHNHGITDPTHRHDVTASTDGHQAVTNYIDQDVFGVFGFNPDTVNQASGYGAIWGAVATSTGVTVNNNTATNQAQTATNQNAGSGSAHNNLQPYIVMNYIIRAA